MSTRTLIEISDLEAREESNTWRRYICPDVSPHTHMCPTPPSLAPRPPPTPPQQSTCLHITVLPSRALGLNCIESVCFCCCRVPKRGSRAARKLCSARLSPLWLRAHSPPASDTCRDVRAEYASTRRVASRYRCNLCRWPAASRCARSPRGLLDVRLGAAHAERAPQAASHGEDAERDGRAR